MNTEFRLYSPIDPHVSGMLSVSDGHTLYWECSGNPSGVPVLVLLGGPGAGCSPKMRQLFDPLFYRIIMFDQRGAGRSRPHASVVHNTTRHLIADIECLREHLQVGRWLIVGGSWGATLALVYAANHPQKCSGLILRGTWLGRNSDINHFMTGMGGHRPNEYATFVRHVGLTPQTATASELLHAYAQRLLYDSSSSVFNSAAMAWFSYEGAFATVELGDPPAQDEETMAIALAMARLELHYFLHSVFLQDGYILDRATNVLRVHQIRGILLHGEHDWICPRDGVTELAQRWTQADLRLIPHAGHSRWEASLTQALLGAIDEFKSSL